MLEQLDDLRPPTFNDHHLQEIERRAGEIRRRRHRNRVAAGAMAMVVGVAAVVYLAPGGHSPGLRVSTSGNTPGSTAPPSSNTTAEGPAVTVPGWPPAGAGDQVIMPTADGSDFVIVNVADHSTRTGRAAGQRRHQRSGISAAGGGAGGL